VCVLLDILDVYRKKGAAATVPSFTSIMFVQIVALAFGERQNGIAIYRSVSPRLLFSLGSVGSQSTTIALSTGSSLLGRESLQRILATSGGPVDDARSATLNRVTAPGSEGGAMPEG